MTQWVQAQRSLALPCGHAFEMAQLALERFELLPFRLMRNACKHTVSGWGLEPVNTQCLGIRVEQT